MIDLFTELALPILEYYYPGRNCISRTRVTIEVLKLCVPTIKAQPCTLLVKVPGEKRCYLASPKQIADRACVEAESFIRLDAETAGEGYEGHLIARYKTGLVDASIDQAAKALGLDYEPSILHIGGLVLKRPYFAVELEATLTGRSDSETPITIQYITFKDRTYLNTPAWELDSVMAECISHITRAIGFEVMREASRLTWEQKRIPAQEQD